MACGQTPRVPRQKVVRSLMRCSPSSLLARVMDASGTVDGLARLACHNGVATLTLNHSAKRNALSLGMIQALHEHVATLRSDSTVRALVVEAAGDAVFSSGHNLVELRSMDRHSQEAMMRLSTATMLALESLPFPTLALVDGLAAAAGAQLVAHCDMAMCTSRSTFSTPGIRYGFFCTTPGAALHQRSTAHSKALMHMLFTGDSVSAADALRMGIVSHVFDSTDKMRVFADHTVAQIVALPRDVIALGKSAFHRQAQMRTHQMAMGFATDVMLDNLQMANTAEGLAVCVGGGWGLIRGRGDRNTFLLGICREACARLSLVVFVIFPCSRVKNAHCVGHSCPSFQPVVRCQGSS